MSSVPWGAALAEASRKQAERLGVLERTRDELLAENARLRVTIVNLRRRLYQAKHVHANWLLRSQAWRAERDDLLRRLRLASPSTPPSAIAYRNWGPGS